ncbi:MAG TPA: hypothetical protein VN734_04365 [Acidobacteriaceae bacterium]|nr:hypothetical protein [Acidobacteriaceae bacterium]
MKKRLYFACAVVALAAAPCFAAGSSWDGTWKLNVAKSKFTGDTFTIEAKGNMMHFSNGVVAFDFACDGKAYPVIADRTSTCSGSPAAGYDFESKAGDKVLAKSHRTFSADGKTMTIHGTQMRADGTSPEFTDVYKRQSGTSGLEGKWMNVKSQGASDTMVIQTKGDWIKLDFPEFKVTVEGKMDGSQLPVTGTNIPPGVTQSFKTDGANKLHYTEMYNGKVLDEGTQTLSADGKTLVDESWAPGKMNEKTTAVYERQ